MNKARDAIFSPQNLNSELLIIGKKHILIADLNKDQYQLTK